MHPQPCSWLQQLLQLLQMQSSGWHLHGLCLWLLLLLMSLLVLQGRAAPAAGHLLTMF
jgi:hypothetical protein